MIEKDLKHLNRRELIELLLEQSRKMDALKERCAELEQQLQDRNIAVTEAGSIAEAALRLEGIFETAQRAADIYLENVRLLRERAAAELSEVPRREKDGAKEAERNE